MPACQITTYYYVGFAYLMMRRYADAIRTFSNILLYIQRTKQQLQGRGYQSDHVSSARGRLRGGGDEDGESAACGRLGTGGFWEVVVRVEGFLAICVFEL